MVEPRCETLEHVRRRERAAEERAEARASAIRARLPEAAAMLRERFSARRIVLFGSLARPGAAHEESDVDLAVEGLSPPVEYFSACAAVEAIVQAPLDLVELDRASPSLLARIAAEGRELRATLPFSGRR